MLSTLIELQRLKRLDRTGWILRGLPNGTESVASHSFGVACTAMLLADELIRVGEKVNMEQIIRISLLHDWAEARVGDMPKTATTYFGAAVRREAETAAFSEMVQPLGNPGLYRELYDDYERRDSLEARLVKAADVIDLLVQVLALERAGARGLDEFWTVTQESDFQLDGRPKQVVDELIQSLLAARRELP